MENKRNENNGGNSAVLEPYVCVGGWWGAPLPLLSGGATTGVLRQGCAGGRAGQGQRCLGLGAQLLIDSACATNATDSPIKAELTEACRHLRLLLLSTHLLIVTPNRGGPPTNTFNFRQRECLNNAAPALLQLQFEIPGYGAGVC